MRERLREGMEMRARETSADNVGEQKRQKNKKQKVREDIRGEGELCAFPCHCRKLVEICL